MEWAGFALIGLVWSGWIGLYLGATCIFSDHLMRPGADTSQAGIRLQILHMRASMTYIRIVL